MYAPYAFFAVNPARHRRGGGGVALIFEIGTDMTRVMLDVVSRLKNLQDGAPVKIVPSKTAWQPAAPQSKLSSP